METDEPTDDELVAQVREKARRPKAEPVSTARNERQYWLDLTAQMLKRPIPHIAKLVEGWPVQWLKDMYLYVNRPDAKNPPALWWWMYRNPKQ